MRSPRILLLLLGTAGLTPSCRLLGVGVPCERDSHCAPGDVCVDGLCATAATGEGEGEGDGEGEGEDGARSCAELRTRRPNAPSDAYTFDGVEVFCEMDVDGGGWTLVGRSAPGGGGAFGWHTSRGALDDTSQPYSLDVFSLGITVHELLVAEPAADGLGVGARAFVVRFDEDLLDPSLAARDTVSVERRVVGTACQGANLDIGFMMKNGGCTDSPESFYLRDTSSPQQPCANFGLYPDGLNVCATLLSNTDACERYGELCGEQGILFAR